MSQIVSRSSLYDDSEPEPESDVEYLAPIIEFDLIEVDPVDDNHQSEENNLEFDFPLFATSTEKVSLEEVVEVINNDRPEAYYFAKYTDKEKAQFAQAALGMTDPYTLQTPIPEPDSPTFTYKLTDLDIHNQKVEAEALRSKIRNTKRRAGKKKREFVVVCRERKLERVKVEKKIKKEQARLRYLAQYNRGKKRKFT